MQTQATVLNHPAAHRQAPVRVRASGTWGDPLLALALIAVAAVALMAALLLTVVLAPLAAGLFGWLAFRSREGARAKRRIARARRRARALGLVVL
jgi:hypothetical protein